ncbi:hypothetical protein ACSSOE_07025 [Intestinibacter bartlettii]|jgi:hypothetical protein|uniref:hypothetical protein n=1 Tax=Intestinibacter bartlettii TaxID=261299 RepID=UPI00206B59FA|nr:MAG TPA: hypothetical protein [Caudoviricetes sp.]
MKNVLEIIIKIIVGAIRLLLYAIAIVFTITMGFMIFIKCEIITTILEVIIGFFTIGALLFVIYYLGDEVVEKFKEKGKNQ